MAKTENALRESQDQGVRAKQKQDSLQKSIKDNENTLKNAEARAKQEHQKMAAERDDLLKQLARLQSKETQYRHDARNKELQIAKMQETIKQKVFGGDKNMGRCEFAGGLQPNNDFKFNKISPDSEFQLMISRDQEEIYKKLSEEN